MKSVAVFGIAVSCMVVPRLGAEYGGARTDSRTSGTLPNPSNVSQRGEVYPAAGITLLKQIDPYTFGSNSANSCWGYVSPSGREYAIIGLSAGTGFVEVTNPANAVIVKLVTGPPSTWRDMKVYQQYNYSVSEAGNGIQVMDMGQIDAGIVTLVTEVTTPGTTATHTVALNEDSGHLYRCGGGGEGLRIYSLADPANPVFVGAWSSRYVHEAQVVTYNDGPYAGREMAFCCGGSNGGFSNTGLYVVEVTDKANPVQLSYYRYPRAAYAHQGWLSPDKSLYYIDDEFDENEFGIPCNVHVIDVTDLDYPVEVAVVSSGSPAIDHNLYTLGRFIFLSNYTAGLRVFDATDPIHPAQIGYFDTVPANDRPIYEGLWSNYPYLPSGIVLGSDIEGGLFIWDIQSIVDCNDNGSDDGVDIADGVSADTDLNRVPDECQPTVHVPSDFATLQAAIDAADFGALIRVADGVYSGPGNYKLDFKAKVLSLKSENGPAGCVIDAGGLGHALVFESGESFGTIVDGFTLRNGLDEPGGAVLADTASPTIRNCVIEDSTSTNFGGAIYAEYSSLVVSNCIVRNNQAEDGGGIFLTDSSAAIQNCGIFGNTASATGGGGLYVRGDIGPRITNCTIAANTAPVNGEAVYVVDGYPVLTNCVIWNDTDSETTEVYAPLGEITVRYCDLPGGWPGEGNLDADPLFTDPDGLDDDPSTVADNDYHLSAASPCIDAGDPAFLDVPPQIDLDDQPRLNGLVDMGWDEYYPSTCEADTNGDGEVDPLDGGYVLARLGCPVNAGNPGCDLADVNGDDQVDPFDYGYVLARFGDCR